VRRGRWAEDPEALRRSARDGVIACAALRELGVPGATVAERCRDGGRWRRNAKVYDAEGRLLGISDVWFDEVALTWEINSYAWHLSPAAYAREIKRTATMAGAGVWVVPVLPTALRDDPEDSLADLCNGYRAAAERPRPPVRAVRSTETG
jgi:hypothetical protein